MLLNKIIYKFDNNYLCCRCEYQTPEDVIHVIFYSSHFNEIRNDFFPDIANDSNILVWIHVIDSEDKNVLIKFVNMMLKILNVYKNLQ